MKAAGCLRKLVSIISFTVIVLCLFCSANAATTTVSTFYDPTGGSLTPVFTVDYDNGTVTGGWDDTKTGLDLVFFNTTPYQDAYFIMTELDIMGGGDLLATSRGTIKFFADGQDSSTTPLLRIDFNAAYVSSYGIGAMDLFGGDVGFSGTAVPNPSLISNECFSFSFSNHQILADGMSYTATASFTSSATVVPEPATMALFGLGSFMVFHRKRK